MSFRLLPFLLLLLSSYHPTFSAFSSPPDVEVSDLPYWMKGIWINSGAKRVGQEAGVAELYKYSDEDQELLRYDIRVYDASLSNLEADRESINRFWRIYMGFPGNVMSSVLFSGYGALDSLEGQLIGVHKDTSLKEAYQIIKPRNMTLEDFSNMPFHSRNHGRYDSEYSSRYGDRHSSCLFVLRLKFLRLPGIDRHENRFYGEGMLESTKCEIKMMIGLTNSKNSINFFRSANLLGIIASILNTIQLAALFVQVLYGWRTKTMSNISVPTVAVLLLLTMHTTTAFSVFADVVCFVRGAFVPAAIASGTCAGAYAAWLVMVWVMQRQKSIKMSILESVILLVATAVTFCLSFLAMRFIPGMLELSSVAMYAFFVPQIVHNRESNSRARAIHPFFAAVAVIVNMFTPVYGFLWAPNFLCMQARPIFAFSLATFLIAQASCLTLQYKGQAAPVPSGYSRIDPTEPRGTVSLVAGRQIKCT